MSDNKYVEMMEIVQTLIVANRNLSREIEKSSDLTERLTTVMENAGDLITNINNRVTTLEKLNEPKEPEWYPLESNIIAYMKMVGCSWEDANLKLKEEHEKSK